LRLRLRYLVSFRGTETYQWHRVTNLVVMEQIRRTLGPNLHLDFNLGAVYGAGIVSISEPTVTIPLNLPFAPSAPDLLRRAAASFNAALCTTRIGFLDTLRQWSLGRVAGTRTVREIGAEIGNAQREAAQNQQRAQHQH
jgi:hypothetical protein